MHTILTSIVPLSTSKLMARLYHRARTSQVASLTVLRVMSPPVAVASPGQRGKWFIYLNRKVITN